AGGPQWGMGRRGRGPLRDPRKHAVEECLEPLPVAEEAKNGDAAAIIEDPPFSRICSEPITIGAKSGQPEQANASLQTLANLFFHLAEARPSQVQPRQSPLQQCGALRIVHVLVDLGHERRAPGRCDLSTPCASCSTWRTAGSSSTTLSPPSGRLMPRVAAMMAPLP